VFTSIFRKNAALGVADADDGAAILDAIVEKTEATAAVAVVKQEEPEPKPAPVAIDPSEVHTQSELQELRDMALAFQARLHQLGEKYRRIGLKTESGKWALYAVPTNGSASPYALPVVVPNDLHVGLRTFLEDCCRQRKPEQKWVLPPKPTFSEEAVAVRRRFIENKLGIPYEQVTGLSEKELAERLNREHHPVTFYRD
jgi:hypothetical protein